LKHEISVLSNKLLINSNKLTFESNYFRRQHKKIASMKQILLQLKNKNLINDDENEILLENDGKHKNLITNWAKKCGSKSTKIAQKYANSLYHFISFLQKLINMFEKSLT